MHSASLLMSSSNNVEHSAGNSPSFLKTPLLAFKFSLVVFCLFHRTHRRSLLQTPEFGNCDLHFFHCMNPLITCYETFASVITFKIDIVLTAELFTLHFRPSLSRTIRSSPVLSRYRRSSASFVTYSSTQLLLCRNQSSETMHLNCTKSF